MVDMELRRLLIEIRNEISALRNDMTQLFGATHELISNMNVSGVDKVIDRLRYLESRLFPK